MRRPGEQKKWGNKGEKRKWKKFLHSNEYFSVLMLLLFEIRSLIKAASSITFLKRIPYTKIVLKLLEKRLFQMGCKGRMEKIYNGGKVYKVNNKQ